MCIIYTVSDKHRFNSIIISEFVLSGGTGQKTAHPNRVCHREILKRKLRFSILTDDLIIFNVNTNMHFHSSSNTQEKKNKQPRNNRIGHMDATLYGLEIITPTREDPSMSLNLELK